MKTLFTIIVLGILYLVGFDRVFLALDLADATMSRAYDKAFAASEQRRCTTRTQLPKRTTRKAAPDGC